MDCWIPRDFDSDEGVRLTCTDEVAQVLHLDKLAAEFFVRSPLAAVGAGGRIRLRQSKARQSFRVVLRDRYDDGSYKQPRFSLPKRAPQKTLEVIARHLDQCGVEWVQFKSGEGSPFRAPRLQPNPMHLAA
jgi:hypothetical protein